MFFSHLMPPSARNHINIFHSLTLHGNRQRASRMESTGWASFAKLWGRRVARAERQTPRGWPLSLAGGSLQCVGRAVFQPGLYCAPARLSRLTEGPQHSVQSTGGGPGVNGNKTARRCYPRWGLLYSCLLPLQHPRLARLRGRTAPVLPSQREGLQVEGRSRGCLYRERQLDPSAPGQAPALLSAPGTSSHRPPSIPRLTPVAASPSAPSRTCRLRICASWRCPFLLPVPLSLFKGDHRIWIYLILSHNRTLQLMHLGLAVGLSQLYPALRFAGGFSPHHVDPSLPLLLVLPLNIP